MSDLLSQANIMIKEKYAGILSFNIEDKKVLKCSNYNYTHKNNAHLN